MRIILLGIFFLVLNKVLIAQEIYGTVKNEQGEALAFASVYIKGSTQGTTSNDAGRYAFKVKKGNYTLVCQFVGFASIEKQIQVNESRVEVNFILSKKHSEIKEVKIIAGGEDPAYAIIRKAIKKRNFYYKQMNAFWANCYIKGKMKLISTPDDKGVYSMFSIMGAEQSPDSMKKEMDSLKGIIYLSESYNEMAFRQNPSKFKIKVLSSKVSGMSNEYGFSSPMLISLYQNNVSIGEQINARGYISPIADGALAVYKYKLLESYFENGQWINKIQIIPRRKFEPTFNGIIHIVDNEWRIHAVDVFITKENEMNVLDSLFLKQIYVKVENQYLVKDQVFGISLKIFGFGVRGDFVNVFSNYNLKVDEHFFDRYTMEFDSLALKKDSAHWESIRAIPLQEEEQKDYHKKDSMRLVEKNKSDSMQYKMNSYNLKNILRQGLGYNFSKTHYIRSDGFLKLHHFQFNAIEGFSYNLPIRYVRKINKDGKFSILTQPRFGFTNQVFSLQNRIAYQWGKSNKQSIHFDIGKNYFQYNRANPIDELYNSLNALFYGIHFLKNYRMSYLQLEWQKKYYTGFSFKTKMAYEQRMGIHNTIANSPLRKKINFTPNYPVEIAQEIMPYNTILRWSFMCRYQPGRKLIKYPDRIVSYNSGKPEYYFSTAIAKPFFNTQSDFVKWKIGIEGSKNLKLIGEFNYHFSMGGFLHNKQVYLPDYTHFNGNQLRYLASTYLHSFQLAPYYAQSNTEKFYTAYHVEHHFNGLGTNKIPLFRKLKYNLVLSSNMYFVSAQNNYMELGTGLENVGFGFFRFFRIDALVAYQNFKYPVYGIKLGLSSSMFQTENNNGLDY